MELVGTFLSDEACAEAIEALHRAHVKEFRAFSPFLSERINEASEEALGAGRSRVRLFVLFGGLTGLTTAVLLEMGTSLEWNLNAGGRAITNIPPYVPIFFELSILLGALSGVAGFFIMNRMPVWEPDPAYRTRFSADRFGLVVRCDEGDAGRIEQLMREAGAEQVVREAA